MYVDKNKTWIHLNDRHNMSIKNIGRYLSEVSNLYTQINSLLCQVLYLRRSFLRIQRLHIEHMLYKHFHKSKP